MTRTAISRAINKKSGIFIILTYIFTKEDDGYVVRCSELDVASQGATIEESEKNIEDAINVFLNSIEAMGIRESVFKDKNIKVYKYKEIPNEENEVMSISPIVEENSFYRKTLIAI